MSNNDSDNTTTNEPSDRNLVKVPFVWKVPDDFVTRHTNHVIAQNVGSDFYITFFEFIPPIVIGSNEEKQAQVARITEVRPTTVARLACSAEAVQEIIAVLQEQLRKYHVSLDSEEDQSIDTNNSEVENG